MAFIGRVVRVVEGAALEMLCGETHLGFESLTLRQKAPLVGAYFILRRKNNEEIFIFSSCSNYAF